MKPRLPIDNARNSDLRGSAAALVRAAQRARDLARRTQTSVVVQRNGKLIHERLDHLDRDPTPAQPS